MELWIRSQSKQSLIKVENISLEIKKDNVIFITSGEWRLGTYKTKERALEILDEIQKKINLINLGHDFGSPMIDLENPTYIYEMPKE